MSEGKEMMKNEILLFQIVFRLRFEFDQLFFVFVDDVERSGA